MTLKKIFTVIFLSMALTLPCALTALTIALPSPDAEYRELSSRDVKPVIVHSHTGFYFNFQLGAGAGWTWWDVGLADDWELSGVTGAFRIRAGYAPVNNFIIYGVYGAYHQDDPTLTIGEASTTMENFALTYYDFGLGFCYYFMPINIYIAADFAATRLRMETTDDSNNKWDSDLGGSITLSIGKEWWVSRNWGLGLALLASAAIVPPGDQIGGDSLRHLFVGMAFTATYN